MPELSRRSFLAAGGALAGATLLPTPALAANKTLALPPGLQLWTVKKELAEDFEGTLRRLSAIGYRQVEAAGWQGRSPDDFRKALDAAGLKPVSCHFGMGDFFKDYSTLVSQARDVGVQYIVASSPHATRALDHTKPWNVALADAMTLADWRRNAEQMNKVGAEAKAKGLRFGYHNHAAEFMEYEGEDAFHELIRLTDPALVAFELDIGWVAAAGHSVVNTIEHHPDRIELLHVKDMDKAGAAGRIAGDASSVPVGKGVIDWRAAFAAADKANIKAWFVEQEEPFKESPLTGLAQSLAHLKAISA